jgi:hypothetical protein
MLNRNQVRDFRRAIAEAHVFDLRRRSGLMGLSLVAVLLSEVEVVGHASGCRSRASSALISAT